MYRDNSGIEHVSYEAACEYYGADTPASLRAEAAHQDAEDAIMAQDEMEARGGPARPFRWSMDWMPW